MPALVHVSATLRQRSRLLKACACVAALAPLLPGCASRAAKSPAPSPAAAPTYVAPAHLAVGRVLSHDAAAGVALVELSPFALSPADLAGRALISRNPDTLSRSARLVASGRRSGTILGVHVVEGVPSPGDEVVLPSSFPPEDTAAPTPPAPKP